MASIYDYQGNPIIIDGSSAIDYDKIVKGVAHRGFSSVAPENTIPAFKLAKQNGFNYVETDIRFTSDNIPVCIHDGSIDRTSNGTGNVGSMTLETIKTYDFGSWKSSDYAGVKIPTFEEFMTLCRAIELHPYIELKTGTQAQIENLVDIVKSYGMHNKVTWISFTDTYLTYVKNYDSKARIGYLVNSVGSTDITTAEGLKTEDNEVFIDSGTYSGSGLSSQVQLCIDADMMLEVWTIDYSNTIRGLNPYITGVTSNSLIAGKVLYDANIT